MHKSSGTKNVITICVEPGSIIRRQHMNKLEQKKNLYKISVIVPIYNIEEYISECIESIAGQTYTNLQIIHVDDGSTDLS